MIFPFGKSGSSPIRGLHLLPQKFCWILVLCLPANREFHSVFRVTPAPGDLSLVAVTGDSYGLAPVAWPPSALSPVWGSLHSFKIHLGELRNFLKHPKESPIAGHGRHLSALPAPSPGNPRLLSVPMDLSLLDISCKQDRTVSVLLCLASFTQHGVPMLIHVLLCGTHNSKHQLCLSVIP